MHQVLIEKGTWVNTITVTPGVVVVAGPRYVAFLPTERPKNLAVELGWGAVTAVPGVVVFREGGLIRGGGKIQPEWVIDQVRAGPLDAQVQQLCSALGGFVWQPDHAKAFEKKFPARRKHRSLWFREEKHSISISRAILIDEFEWMRHHLLAGWTWQT